MSYMCLLQSDLVVEVDEPVEPGGAGEDGGTEATSPARDLVVWLLWAVAMAQVMAEVIMVSTAVMRMMVGQSRSPASPPSGDTPT